MVILLQQHLGTNKAIADSRVASCVTSAPLIGMPGIGQKTTLRAFADFDLAEVWMVHLKMLLNPLLLKHTKTDSRIEK